MPTPGHVTPSQDESLWTHRHTRVKSKMQEPPASVFHLGGGPAGPEGTRLKCLKAGRMPA